MCVVSAMHDHFGPKIDNEWERLRKQLEEQAAQPYVNNPAYPGVGQVTWKQEVDLTELRALIAEFRELVAAAKKIDVITGQPDCVDPEKAKLEDRVQVLEAQMAKLTEAFKP